MKINFLTFGSHGGYIDAVNRLINQANNLNIFTEIYGKTGQSLQEDAEFINKHGLKEWSKVVQLKVEVEKEEKMFKKAYNSDLGKSKRAMMWCIFFASWVTYFLYINKII